MKKLFFVFAAAGLLFSFSSCKKDYTCSCTGGSLGTASYDIKDATKADAEDACDAFTTGGVHTSCELK